MRIASWLLPLVLAATVTSAGRAGDKAAAESLFQEGKTAMQHGDLQHACELFDASNRAEPSVGALLNLALCHEKQHKSATAWAEFNQAAEMAGRAGQQERAAGARRRADVLKPHLSHLTIEVPTAAARMRIERDGLEVPRGAWGAALPVDPGEHVIEATAPGYRRWAATVTVGAEAAHATLSVPALEAEAGPSARAAPPVASTMSGVELGGYVMTGVGAAVLGAGVVLGIVALNDTAALEGSEQCPSKQTCTGDWQDQVDSIALEANLSTAGIALGAAAVAGGVLLVLLAPDGGREQPGEGQATVQPLVGPGVAGVAIHGSF